MIWPAIRRMLTWMSVSLGFAFLAAPRVYSARESYAGTLNGPARSIVDSDATHLLLLCGILALAAASAALAVRMVRRSH